MYTSRGACSFLLARCMAPVALDYVALSSCLSFIRTMMQVDLLPLNVVSRMGLGYIMCSLRKPTPQRKPRCVALAYTCEKGTYPPGSIELTPDHPHAPSWIGTPSSVWFDIVHCSQYASIYTTIKDYQRGAQDTRRLTHHAMLGQREASRELYMHACNTCSKGSGNDQPGAQGYICVFIHVIRMACRQYPFKRDFWKGIINTVAGARDMRRLEPILI